MKQVKVPIPNFIGGMLIKDLQEDEIICEHCNGTGLKIEDNVYGIQGEKTTEPFPYKHQSISFCPHCYNGVAKVCPYCGKILGRNYSCDCEGYTNMKNKEAHQRNKERYEKAKKVKYSEYNIGCLWDENTDKYFYDAGEMEDYYEDNDLEMPKWCYGCEVIPFEIDIDSALESASENMYEDFDYRDLNDLNELTDFVEEWNKKQTSKTFESDYGIVVLLEE